MSRWFFGPVALVVSGAMMVAGCGSGRSKTNAANIVIGTSADFPPMLSKVANGQLQGFEVDMVKDVMGRLGDSYTFQQQDFSGLLPALQSSRIKIIVSDMYATAARKQVVDFIPYAQSSLGFLVASDHAGTIKSFMDVCGKSVGALIGSPPETSELQTKSQDCTSAGKPGINIGKYQTVPQELADIDNGRLYTMFEDIATEGDVQHTTNNKYSLEYIDPGFLQIGIAIQKNDPLESSLRNAVNGFLHSPAYAADAKKWGLPAQSLIQ